RRDSSRYDDEVDPAGFFQETSGPSKARKISKPSTSAGSNISVHDAHELGYVPKRSQKEVRSAAAHGRLTGSNPTDPSFQIPEGAPNCLEGKKFVITGNLPGLSREDAEDLIKRYGGQVVGSVSKRTSFLIVGTEPGATKVNKAKAVGTPVLYLDSLLEMVRESRQTQEEEEAAGSTPTTADEDEMEVDEEKVIGFPAGNLPTLSKKTFNYSKMKAGNAPLNPGSKEIPVGRPGCFEGMTFVVTGNLESLSREEMEDLIKSYGGRVTKNVSSKTSYLVVGEEPGPSKVEKAKVFKTWCLSEDDVLELIRASNPDATKTAGKPAAADEHAPAVKSEPSFSEPEAIDMADEPSVKTEPGVGAKPVEKPKPSAPAGRRASSSASKGKERATCSLPVAGVARTPANSELWTDKYKPKSLDDLCGHKTQAQELIKWLGKWAEGYITDPRAVLISGPPGIGKTTVAHLASKIAGFDVLELNASEQRNKKSLQEALGPAIGNRSIREFDQHALSKLEQDNDGLNPADKKAAGQSGRKKLVIIMDEVDGMSGGDRGGNAELIQLIKRTKVPIICICNDRSSPKVRTLANYCNDMRFRRPSAAQMQGRMKAIAKRENLQVEDNALQQLVASTQNDIRQIINLLSSYALKSSSMSYLDGKAYAAMNKKEVAVGPFDIIGKYLNGGENMNMSFADKIDLYYNDFSITPLFVQENYIDNTPNAARTGSKSQKELDLGTLECLAEASDYISQADVVDSKIRGSQQWGLMPLHSVMSCVGPAYHMRGSHNGMYRFPGWLGQNSKGAKTARLLREIQGNMRLRVSVDKTEIRKSYIPAMVPELTQPLIDKHTDGADAVIEIMDHYYLNKDNWDSMLELHLHGTAILKQIPAPVKSSFTREYNKRSHPIAFQSHAGASAARAAASAAAIKPDDEGVVDDDMAEADDDEDDSGSDEDVANDKLIKPAKPKGKRKAPAASKASSSKRKAPAKSKARK
ncbi:DNA replication factor C complex subunit Rfc1, partial [Linderina pennispora]